MNRYFLIGVVILAWICFFSTIAYTCEPIDVYIGDWRKYVAVSEYGSATVDVTAVVYSGGPAIEDSWSWSAPSVLECDGIERNEYNSTATYWSDTTGRYTVWASARNASYSYDDDYAYVYVVEVDISGSFEYIALNGDPMEVDISLLPSELTNGTVNLTVSGGITVYYDQAMNYPVPSQASWSVARDQVPSSVWVKGTSVSSSAWDASLFITYDNGGTIDSDETYFTVLNVQITEPDGDPDYDHQFVFNSDNPGICRIPETGLLRGTTGIETLDDDLAWTLEDIPGSFDGSEVTFTYTGLPSSNLGLGKKTLTLTHGPSQLQDTMDLEIFFPKWEYNHGGDDDSIPNWFYYWRQGAAPISDFEYDSSKDWCGYYDPVWDKLYLCPEAPESSGSDDTNVTLYNHYYHTSIHSGRDGLVSSTKFGDDYQVLSAPEPETIAITSGDDPYIDTEEKGDDKVVYNAEYGGEVLHTGNDGVLDPDTEISEDDEWMWYSYDGNQYNIEPGGGRPFATIITWDHPNTTTENDWLNSLPYWDEEVSDDKIDLTGALDTTLSMAAETTGIYMVAFTCTHEMVHRMVWGYVCTNPYDDPPKYYSYTNDFDRDHVHDSILEGTSPYYLCPYRADTYNMTENYFPQYGPYDDNELLAYKNQTSVNADPDYDWSDTDGAQWHK